MSDDGLGAVIKVRDRPKSRRHLTVTASGFDQTNVTLAAGVMGTDDGIAVVRQAADREMLAMAPRRNKPRKVQG